MQNGLHPSAGAVLNWQTPDPAASHDLMDPGCPASSSTCFTGRKAGASTSLPTAILMLLLVTSVSICILYTSGHSCCSVSWTFDTCPASLAPVNSVRDTQFSFITSGFIYTSGRYLALGQFRGVGIWKYNRPSSCPEFYLQRKKFQRNWYRGSTNLWFQHR